MNAQGQATPEIGRTFDCAGCGRTHATLQPRETGPLLTFNADGVPIRRVYGTLFSICCPTCGHNQEFDLPLSDDEFDRVKEDLGTTGADNGWHPFGADGDWE